VLGRLSAMPNEATPLQRAQLLAALSAGCEIIHLECIARHLDLGPRLSAVLASLAESHGARAIAQLTRLDGVLATDAVSGPGTNAALRARASILVLAEVLTKHGAYFDTEAGA
jgi:hypothetical protein